MSRQDLQVTCCILISYLALVGARMVECLPNVLS